MLDFIQITTKPTKNGGMTIFPTFKVYPEPKDLLIRGKDFYAIWDEEEGMWSTKESVALSLIDRELDKYVAENQGRFEKTPQILYMWDADSGMVDKFHKFCQKQMRDTYITLDKELVFSNTDIKRETYASKKLPYPLEAGDISSWDKIIGTLYDPEERRKIEWAIGAIVSGDSRWIQKFLVFYGPGGTGKSTIMNIVQQLFEGYYATFDAKSLGSNNNQYSLEPFKDNPLVAIQHDGDLSRIEDNAKLNSLISHESLVINQKYKGLYETSFQAFLMLGTNRPVKITDAKSGLLRRLIDVSPSERKLGIREYRTLTEKVKFELGAIAYHCLQVYKEDPHYYDGYVARSMIAASNDFYNYMIDSFSVFKKHDGTTLKAAWEMYKTYVEDAKVQYPHSRRTFQEELKNYFWKFETRAKDENGHHITNYYSGFRLDKFEDDMTVNPSTLKAEPEPKESWLDFKEQDSIFDKECSDCPAQYTSDKGTPMKKWDDVKICLKKIDTSKLHYVKVPENHIVIDFDIKDENGEKSFEKNLEAASKWPATYAELSKSGGGIHLHYIYTGDVSNLSRIYDEDIEIKIFTGNSSLRRRLTKCVNLAIATLSSGLPIKVKGGKSVVNFDGLKSERALRTVIKRHLNKEIRQNTSESVQLIAKTLDEVYEQGLCYDVTDMRNAIYAFAAASTNQAETNIKLVNNMKFKSEEASTTESEYDEIVFFDIEVFPNLFLVNWKVAGEGKPVVRMINPKPHEIEELIKYKLIGFNNRDYDNHMLYGCLMGYNNEQLYNLSKRLISKDPDVRNNAKFREAFNLSYTDVYDFSSAANKQSLKKWEVELGLSHQELGFDWDSPVPEDKWEEVADYCNNDVLSTEAVFYHLKGDWTARQILAELTGLTVNDKTNTLTTKFIFGNERKPELIWTDLATGKQYDIRGDEINESI